METVGRCTTKAHLQNLRGGHIFGQLKTMPLSHWLKLVILIAEGECIGACDKERPVVDI